VTGALLRELLPPEVACREAYDDDAPAPLFPVEEAAVAGAVTRRRQEFATARRCAREALCELGFPEAPIPVGATRQPCWPAGVVGSITHCAGYRAAALARRTDLAAVGVDAEPHEPLPDGVLDSVARPAESAWVGMARRDETRVAWDRLLFSAKEAVYKAWFPLTGRWLGFDEVTVAFGPDTFTAVAHPTEGAVLVRRFTGRWLVRRGLVVTAVTVTRGDIRP
jgi:4'-phosphopantetheinyl transferase EntD